MDTDIALRHHMDSFPRRVAAQGRLSVAPYSSGAEQRVLSEKPDSPKNECSCSDDLLSFRLVPVPSLDRRRSRRSPEGSSDG